MNAQRNVSHTLVLEAGQARRLPAGSVVITLVEGRAWVTAGDGQDLVMSHGHALAVSDARQVVIEPFDAASRVVLRWQPIQAPVRDLRWRALPGAVLSALARSAASVASRTHGAMSAGDSMASSGAVK